MTPAAYDEIADIYDQHWGQDSVSFARSMIDQVLAPLLPRHARVIDLCCGTGLIAGYLSAAGYRVLGVDESVKMLNIARARAPKAEFQLADMAQFRSPGQFDAAVSFYNSMNHARSHEHLRETLRNVAKHLRRGGVMLFDYVAPQGFELAWEWSERSAAGRTLEYRYDPESRQAICIVDRRTAIVQNAFEASLIHQALKDAGLAVLADDPVAAFIPSGARRVLLASK
jgi:SAM-dependent methyltransferase